ncbi:MAG TPA: hypothetical protein VLB86_08320 [Gaiellaceae bacterium]|nr:hypothetical protein [Gaiellaceae bacterium]
MTGRFAAAALAAALAAGVAGCTARAGREPAATAAGTCPPLRVDAGASARAWRALRARRDVLGEALLAAPGGPTFERVRRSLPPLLLARAPGRTPLTDSGFHYLPFAVPRREAGAATAALHVADGSQVVSRSVDGRSLTVHVGRVGRERYGSCRSRLGTARLASGWLPILATRYVDAAGVRYRQESFAAGIAQTPGLVSFVRLTADARAARADARIRFTPSVTGIAARGNRLVRGTAVHLLFSSGGRLDRSSVAYRVPRGAIRTAYAAWLTQPGPVEPLTLNASTYGAARRSVDAYWRGRLAEGARIDVPERRVLDAIRGLLVQNLTLTWRYSIGNPYEEFSFPEGIDVAQVMGEHGFAAVERAILRTSLTRRPTPYPNWKRGEKLVGHAAHYRRFRDRAYVEEVTPVLRGYVETLGRQLDASPRSLLARERYSSDIADSVYGLHSQAVAWQGLRAMSHVWAETGETALAARSRALAVRLEAGLRRAVRSSRRRLPDGSLFVPVRLLDPERPYGTLTETRSGSYWNLVMPYALASGLFPPGGAEATGIYDYMLRHGSRLLGLVRAGAYALYGRSAFPRSGTDQVYGINVARFLADEDEPDQLVLSLYGQLGAAMSPGTFAAGEAASVAPLGGTPYRSMYLPPNSAANAAFLETVRVMLVHETTATGGRPGGLELAFATPRAWLRAGRRIAVAGVPTAFGPVSFSLQAGAQSVGAQIEVPARTPPALRLRIRLPEGTRMTGVLLDGRAYPRFDSRTQVVDLSGLTGRLELVVRTARRSR